MKNLTLILLLGSFSVMANDPTIDNTSITQDTIQQNDAINSPTSVMQNTQVNSGVTFDSFGGGVTCAKSTLQMGAISSVDSRYNQGTQLYVGVNIPIGNDTDCEEAARKQNSLVHQKTMQLKSLIRNNNELHEQEIKKQNLLYADLLAKVCRNYHEVLVAKNDTTMAIECDKYRVIDHHKPKYDTNEYSRIGDH